MVGQIFSETAIDDAVLFDQNTIVDLSRIGSTETKALLMGVLVLKLNEYRQSTAAGTNCPLKHITILEEAHNLLKRTSTEQGQESSNVQGKSVEMISNSIAEMRTYGEGFIIVDQSPTAVDISAIKNTNTKIVMRLPEYNDCESVGHSIGLNEEQILELSKLDKGVAAVYQNNWLEAVLTKIDKCSDRYEIKSVQLNNRTDDTHLIGDILAELIAQKESDDFNMSWFNTILNSSRSRNALRERCRNLLIEYQTTRKTAKNNEKYNELVFDLINCNDVFRIFENKMPPLVRKKSEINKTYKRKCNEWVDCVYYALDNYADFPDQKTKDSVFMSILLHKIASEKKNEKYKLILFCI